MGIMTRESPASSEDPPPSPRCLKKAAPKRGNALAKEER